jgi:hypothetical protein
MENQPPLVVQILDEFVKEVARIPVHGAELASRLSDRRQGVLPLDAQAILEDIKRACGWQELP